MRKTLVVVFAFIVGSSLAQDQDRYTMGMEKAFALWKAEKPTEAANLFERIANAEDDNWLPYYYIAQINTFAAFGEKDEDKLKQQLSKAKEFLDIAKGISPDNPELLVQEAMINTAWMAYDGATYGPALAGKNTQFEQPAGRVLKSRMGYGFGTVFWKRYGTLLQRCGQGFRTFCYL